MKLVIFLVVLFIISSIIIGILSYCEHSINQDKLQMYEKYLSESNFDDARKVLESTKKHAWDSEFNIRYRKLLNTEINQYIKSKLYDKALQSANEYCSIAGGYESVEIFDQKGTWVYENWCQKTYETVRSIIAELATEGKFEEAIKLVYQYITHPDLKEETKLKQNLISDIYQIKHNKKASN